MDISKLCTSPEKKIEQMWYQKDLWPINLRQKLKEMGRRLREGRVSESSSEETASDDGVPDGGWGWVVCLGSFLVNFILDGTMFSFGVLLLDLLAYFGEGKANTALVGSALLGMSMFMGPVVSVLLERYSCRQVTIAGTLLSVTAFIASTFSPNVSILIITYGIIGGIGFSMSFISAIIVVGLYFSRKRAIATGIAMSGSGVGTFAYAYLTNYLIVQYDWRGTILIIGGLLLHGLICGLLFRPIAIPKSVGSTRSGSVSSNSLEDEKVEEIRNLLLEKTMKGNCDYLHADSKPLRLAQSTDFGPSMAAADEKLMPLKLFTSQYEIRDGSHHHRRHGHEPQNPMSQKDIFYSGSLARFPHHSTCEDDDTSCDDTDDSLVMAGDSTQSAAARFFINNLKLFKNKTFVLLLLCNVSWTVHSIPLTYVPDLGVSKDLPMSQAAMLISLVGITNIIGRILSGIVTDVFRVKSTITYTGALLMASVTNFLFPWCYNFTTLAVCCVVFGLCMATVVSMRTIVLADYLGIENLTRAFGVVAMFQGVAFLTNAPLAGFLYETLGQSYVMPFSYAGLMYFFSSIFCLWVHCTANSVPSKMDKPVEIIVTSTEDHCREKRSYPSGGAEGDDRMTQFQHSTVT